MKWIKDSLPIEGVDHLLFDGEDFYVGFLVNGDSEAWAIQSYDWEKKSKCLIGLPDKIKITHWMPLPEKPVGKKKEC